MPHPQRLRDDSIPALATGKREFSPSAALAERIVLGAISPQFQKDLEELSDGQLQYCSNDVIYLHKIKDALSKMLKRENRLELYISCIQFLKTRIKLDQNLFTDDIFAH